MKQGAVSGRLIANYGNSLPNLLQSCYPEYPWKWYQFRVKKNTVSPSETYDKSKVSEFLDYLEKKLHIKNPSEWYTISKRHIQRFGGSSIVDKVNLPSALLLSILGIY